MMTRNEYELLFRCTEIRKELLPEGDLLIGEALKFIARFFYETSEDTKTALPLMEQALAIF